MVPFTILLDDQAAAFYLRVAEEARRPIELVLSDTLFKLAGELSLQALARQRKE